MEALKEDDLMPFGKYKNCRLEDVPDWHLGWMKNQIEDKAPNKRSLTQKMLLKYILNRI